MYLHKFNKNMYIFKENDQAAALYILKEVSIKSLENSNFFHNRDQ